MCGHFTFAVQAKTWRNVFFLGSPSFITASVYCLFISLRRHLICLSEKSVRSSLYQCKVLPFSLEELLVSLCTFQVRIVLWLHVLFSPTFVSEEILPSTALDSRGIFDWYQVIVDCLVSWTNRDKSELSKQVQRSFNEALPLIYPLIFWVRFVLISQCKEPSFPQGDPNLWSFVVESALHSGEHYPDSNHGSKHLFSFKVVLCIERIRGV